MPLRLSLIASASPTAPSNALRAYARLITAKTAASIALLYLVGHSAHAAGPATTTVGASLAVVTASCTIQNSAGLLNAVTLPAVSSPDITFGQWAQANALITANMGGAWKTSTAWEREITIGCDAASVPITGFRITPKGTASLFSGQEGEARLVASASSNSYIFGPNARVSAELVKVNSTAVAHGFNGAAATYSTVFATDSNATSKATLRWRPTITATETDKAANSSSIGIFSTEFVLTINY